MERPITFTSATGETTSCSVYDIADTLSVWYPDAPAEVTDAISELARKVIADRYPETSEEDALLGEVGSGTRRRRRPGRPATPRNEAVANTLQSSRPKAGNLRYDGVITK